MMRTPEKQNLTWLILALPLFFPIVATAAENTLNGGVSLGQAYDSNIYRDSSNEESEWKSILTPSLLYTRSEPTNTLSLKYAPGITYNYRNDDKYMDQFASAKYDLLLSQKLQIHFLDTYLLTDEPYSDPTNGTSGISGRPDSIQISDQRGQNRYWTNNLTTSADYEYAQESIVSIGYQYYILDNKDDTIADFVKNSPHLSIRHHLNQQWDTKLAYRFIKGDFDDVDSLNGSNNNNNHYNYHNNNINNNNNSEDLTTNASDVYLYYNFTPFSSVFGHYGYSQTDYDGIQEDYDSHTLSAGANHRLSPTLSLGGEGGASLLQRDSADTNAFYMRLSLNQTWEKSSWILSADSGLDEQQFSGVNDLGLSRYWMIRNAFNHTFTKDITGMASLSFRDDTYLDRVPQEKEQELQGDALLAYSFSQWYQLSLRYTYVNHQADLAINEYDDHRILLQLSAAKDLLKW